MDDKSIDEHELPEDLLQSKPNEPSSEDCCGGGCSLCIYDIYEQELKIWKKECLMYLNGLHGKNLQIDQEPAISPDKYSKFEVLDVIPQTKNCHLYRFAVPKDKSLNLKLGQHFILRGKVDNETITRQYTPVSPVCTRHYFDMLIKLYDEGKMSKYISTWHPGMEVEWRGPFGSFEYKSNSFKKLFMIAGGSGIAPLLPIILFIVQNEDDETFIHLMFACKMYTDILLKSRLNELKHFWNFSVGYYLSQEQDRNSAGYGEEVHYGRIDEEVVAKKISLEADTKVLICGSTQFNNCMKKYICDIGFNEAQCFVF